LPSLLPPDTPDLDPRLLAEGGRLPVRRDLVCTSCGYGVVASSDPPRCPMCGGSDWDFEPWRPFGRPAAGLLPPS
jgi:hypothetical protein